MFKWVHSSSFSCMSLPNSYKLKYKVSGLSIKTKTLQHNKCCVWAPFYDVHVNRVEWMQRKLIRFALCGLGWTGLYDLAPYEDRCALFHIDKLFKRRTVVCIMFVFDILSGRVRSMVHIVAPWYQSRFVSIARATVFMRSLVWLLIFIRPGNSLWIASSSHCRIFWSFGPSRWYNAFFLIFRKRSSIDLSVATSIYSRRVAYSRNS
jgi:hypothetical protein